MRPSDRRRVFSGCSKSKVDFAASDVATSPEGATLQRFATVLGAVVPIYNLCGVDRELRFTPEILAGIYMGKITRWDAPEIRAANRGVSLPNAPIVVIHRSDGSGTTYAFTDFLAKTSSAWKSAVGAGSTVQWPVGIGRRFAMTGSPPWCNRLPTPSAMSSSRTRSSTS